jgi:hypothetical protein
VPAKPRRYQRAVANAQEAHEAIRPAGDAFRAPAELRQELARDELALPIPEDKPSEAELFGEFYNTHLPVGKN